MLYCRKVVKGLIPLVLADANISCTMVSLPAVQSNRFAHAYSGPVADLRALGREIDGKGEKGNVKLPQTFH